MKGLSDLDPANPPELRRFEIVDPDMLLNVTEECGSRRCSLQEGHEGPHAEIAPLHGRIYDVWGQGGVQVSDEALRVARQINRARDEAISALDEIHFLRVRLHMEHKEIAKEDDPILRMLLDDYEYWPSSALDLDESGFEAEDDDELRSELLDIFEGEK